MIDCIWIQVPHDELIQISDLKARAAACLGAYPKEAPLLVEARLLRHRGGVEVEESFGKGDEPEAPLFAQRFIEPVEHPEAVGKARGIALIQPIGACIASWCAPWPARSHAMLKPEPRRHGELPRKRTVEGALSEGTVLMEA